ncbi:MAG: Tn3 family transposase [Candidatus Entotheonellia bacterium]
MVENWNIANEFIFYGRSGEIASHRLDDQELTMQPLHFLQACLVDVNTLMLQQVRHHSSFRRKEPTHSTLSGQGGMRSDRTV